MASENKNSDISKIMQMKIKENAERIKFMNEVFSEIGKSVKALNDFGNQIEEAKKINFSKYFNDIRLYIPSLNDSTATCEFLIGEKRKLNDKIIDSNIRKDGYDRKYYESILNIIIEPLFKHWQDELEFEKNNPQKKQIEIVPVIETAPKPNKIVTTTKLVEPIPQLPFGFSQIKCKATKEEIRYYFMILSKEKNNLTGEFFMTEEDVIEFVHKNFSIFNLTPSGKYFPINLLPKQKGILRHFVYRFYTKYDQKELNTKIKYAKLLINNFDIFKDDKPGSLLTNMRESKKPKTGAIPISKYFKK